MIALLPEWISLANLIHCYFAIIILAAIQAATLPFLRSSILNYGKLNEKGTSQLQAPTNQPQKKYPRVNNSQLHADQLASALRSMTVPKYWFAHFYVWATIWMIYVTADIYHFATSTNTGVSTGWPWWSFLHLLQYFGVSIVQEAGSRYASTPLSENTVVEVVPWFLMGIYLLHVMRRWYESWYVERPSPTARMHVGHYLVGITFYSAVPLALWIDAVEYPSHVQSASQWISMHQAIRCVGVVLFLWASYHQHICHRILADLRPKSSHQPAKKSDVHDSNTPPAKTSTYRVPHGDWFDYFVCPHYIAEMLIYFSFYLIASATLQSPLGFSTLLI
ncbi:Steroid 5 alpha-reductase 3, partial [Actinomortierella wolfii]